MDESQPCDLDEQSKGIENDFVWEKTVESETIEDMTPSPNYESSYIKNVYYGKKVLLRLRFDRFVDLIIHLLLKFYLFIC